MSISIKKVALVATAATVISAPAMAESREGLYVQADAGFSTLKFSENGSLSENAFSPIVSVGYDFGNNVRAALDYTHYKDVETDGMEAKVRGAGVSVVYDIDTGSSVKPFVGARVSTTKTDIGLIDGQYSAKKYKTGIGAMVGANFRVSDNVDLEAGYRYNYLGKANGVKVQSNEVTAGIRIRF